MSSLNSMRRALHEKRTRFYMVRLNRAFCALGFMCAATRFVYAPRTGKV